MQHCKVPLINCMIIESHVRTGSPGRPDPAMRRFTSVEAVHLGSDLPSPSSCCSAPRPFQASAQATVPSHKRRVFPCCAPIPSIPLPLNPLPKAPCARHTNRVFLSANLPPLHVSTTRFLRPRLLAFIPRLWWHKQLLCPSRT